MSVATAAPPAKPKRGRETAADMIRSLGLVLLIVVPLWFLAQPPSSDEQTLRVVDPTPDVTAFRAAAPGVPVPTSLPEGWRPTSSTLQPSGLRIGYVTPAGEYAEYVASTRPEPEFLPDATGEARQVGELPVAGLVWRQLSDGDGHTSLVRSAGGGTVLVGGLRETATLAELRVLAGAVR